MSKIAILQGLTKLPGGNFEALKLSHGHIQTVLRDCKMARQTVSSGEKISAIL
jgi:hypothetical protein